MKSQFFGKLGLSVLAVPVTAVAFLASCYSFVPTSQSVFPARNDVGRVNLANRIGPEVMQLSGVVRDQTGADYTVGVQSLTYLNGRTAQWSGELVTVRQEFVKSAFQRKFSSGRTAAAVIAGAGIVGGALLANNLNGSGDKTPG